MEGVRRQLEQLDRIEDALVARICRSSQWLPPGIEFNNSIPSRKLSSRECALQRWEAAKLIVSYNEISNQISGFHGQNSSLDFDTELEKCMVLSDTTPAYNLANSYAQHRWARGLERFVSDATEEVLHELDAKYPPEEQWGQILRLEPFYRALIAKDEVPAKPKGYREYLVNFDFYAEFAEDSLAQYLIDFYNRAISVGPGTQALDLPVVREVLDHTTADPLYCTACNHRFTNEAVYKAHLSGRKHKRAAQHPKNAALSPGPQLIRVLASVLQEAFASTIADIDRKAGMTVQERKLEVEAMEREREQEDTMLSGEETDSVSVEPGPTKQLLGPEGTPIPRWLYKLHGLNTTFKCKICEPHVKIAGRSQFERHFRDQKHLQSLRRLGITPSDAYRGIITVSDALELQQALKNKPTTLDKEVEDDEGNVMSEKMMADLRKQGLI